MTESAFGRPAKWSGAWPAMAVGLTAFLLAVYGTFLLPNRLPAHYASKLEQAQQRYQRLVEKSHSSSGQRLIDAAGEMDVIFSRLVELEANSPQRYWQWVAFLQEHADRLLESLNDPALSLSPPVRTLHTDQVSHFQSKSQELLEQLAVRPSELQSKALLRVTERKYREGLGEFGVREADKLAQKLASLLDTNPNTNADATNLTPAEFDAARLLLVQLHLEAAWQVQNTSNLMYDLPQLEAAWKLFQRFRNERQSSGDELQWYATGRLIAVLAGQPFHDADKDAERHKSSSAETGSDWKQELSQLQLSAIDGEWTEVANQLRSRLDSPLPEVTSGLARTICRLAVSPMAHAAKATSESDAIQGKGGEAERNHKESAPSIENDVPAQLFAAEQRATLSSWSEQADVGILLAAQLGAHLPELSELAWECARQQAGEGAEHVSVPTNLAQSIMGGQSGWLKHSLAALAATLEGQAATARTHLQLLGRSRGSPSLIARVALWRAQMIGAKVEQDPLATLDANATEDLLQLTALLEDIVQLEPGSGLNWFVLGTLQFRQGHTEDMKQSLSKARELLGEVPAIEQMLEAAL